MGRVECPCRCGHVLAWDERPQAGLVADMLREEGAGVATTKGPAVIAIIPPRKQPVVDKESGAE